MSGNGQQLPLGWVRSEIGDLLAFKYGKSLPEKERKPGTIPVYGSNGPVGTHDQSLVDGPAIIVGRKGSVGAVHYEPGPCWPIDTTYYLDDFPHLNPLFVFHQLRYLRLGQLEKSTAIPGISRTDVNTKDFVVSPLREQERIVDALDELSSDLDAGETALKRVQEKLKLYRASVLKAAVEGDLTAEWRVQHSDVEPASELLKRILVERRRRWEEEQLRKFEEKRKEAPKNWKTRYKEPFEPDTSELPPLPEGWCWATVSQLAAPGSNAITDGPFGSELKTEHYTRMGPRVIRLQNIKDGAFSDERAHITEERFSLLKKHRIFAGDLVIAALGDNPPRACVIPDGVGPAIVKADCIRFKPHESLMPQCINYFLNAAPTRLRTKKLVHGVGRPRMNLDEIRSIVLPIPPCAEQEAIVKAVEDQLSIIDLLQAEIETKLRNGQVLRQAILRHAFTGQLVLQDLNDEPASELLERIAAKREARAREIAATKRSTKSGKGPHIARSRQHEKKRKED